MLTRRLAFVGSACALLLLVSFVLLPSERRAAVAPSVAAVQPLATEPALTPVASPTPEPKRAPTSWSVERALGQRLVSGYRGAHPSASLLAAVRAGRLGGVILFGENVPTLAIARRSIRSLQAAARAGHQPPLLIMVDQEGGDVRRFESLPPRVSPAWMGAAKGPAATAHDQGRRTGMALRSLGVNVDLAPVADVPAQPDSFLGERAFSRSRAVVARAACGFAAGLASTGVAATLKHFPGLGRASANTDLEPVRIDAARAALAAEWSAYTRCGPQVPLVMLSSAAYPSLGIDGPAVLDRRTHRWLATTGFKGLTITDAFDTPSISGQFRPARRALGAGVDLLLYGSDEAGARQAYTRLLEDIRAGRLSRSALRSKAERLVAFKRALEAE